MENFKRPATLPTLTRSLAVLWWASLNVIAHEPA
jgi:hypothetical protein